MNSIFKRKSIRQFKKQKIEDEKILNILKAGMQAPSAMNTQPWEFLVINDEKSLKDISKMSPYAKPAKNADTLIIPLVNLEYVPKTKEWFPQDMSATCENILLQSVEEGLGAVWLGFYPNEERVQNLKDYYELPENIIPFAVIAIGYPDEKQEIENRFDKNRIHFNEY